MLRRQRPLCRLVYVAFVVGVVLLITATTQLLSSLWATDSIAAYRQPVSCKYNLLYVYTNRMTIRHLDKHHHTVATSKPTVRHYLVAVCNCLLRRQLQTSFRDL